MFMGFGMLVSPVGLCFDHAAYNEDVDHVAYSPEMFSFIAWSAVISNSCRGTVVTPVTVI